MTDWITLVLVIVGLVLQPILYELSPLPDIIDRIRARKKRKNWWERLISGKRG